MTDQNNTPPPPTGAPVTGGGVPIEVIPEQGMQPPPPSGVPVAPSETGMPAPSEAGVSVASSETGMPVMPADVSGATTEDASPVPPTGSPLSPPSGEPLDVAAQDQDMSPPPPVGQPKLYGHQTNLKNGINKCPHCGSSDMQLNPATGLLHCNFCHREFSEAADTIDGDIAKLSGIHMGMGASDIVFDASDVITLKCTACGAEVVVDTNEAPQARCHWCRHMLSLNQQVPNGAVPDAVLPFRVTKEEARSRIEQFVGKRKFFAHPRFKAEFSTENIMGVYLPYMVIDVNAHAVFRGEGEHETRRYTVGSGNDKETRYDADLYAVARDFDLHINDLTVEASTDKLNQDTAINSNNIINSILPFPTHETLQFNANYLRGFTSEKRGVNRSQVESIVGAQVRDIARWKAWQNALFYDRGIRWDVENVEIIGELWKTVYLPVWLYSYLETKSNGSKFLHYVAVNACTGETMGSVPIHMPKLIAVSVLVEIVGAVIGIFLAVILFLFS